MGLDPAEQEIANLPRGRLVQEALRAHRALMRYGKHDENCPQHLDQEEHGTTCECGLDAAAFSPFIEEGKWIAE